MSDEQVISDYEREQLTKHVRNILDGMSIEYNRSLTEPVDGVSAKIIGDLMCDLIDRSIDKIMMHSVNTCKQIKIMVQAGTQVLYAWHT